MGLEDGREGVRGEGNLCRRVEGRHRAVDDGKVAVGEHGLVEARLDHLADLHGETGRR
jgi:hypothetical protein